MSITFDEVWTIESFVPLSVYDIINCFPCDANNHLASTLIIKLFQGILGDSLFVSRLPNLLASIVYISYAFKISRQHLGGITGSCFYIVLLSNPFVLDFFSLARGYGLSLAALIASFYFLLDYLKSGNMAKSFIALAFASFSVLSNFSLLNYWLALFFVIHFYALINFYPREFLRLLYGNVAILYFTALLIYNPISTLVKQGHLYYGGRTGFYADTLLSLTTYSTAKTSTSGEIISFLNAFLILFLLTVIINIGTKPKSFSLTGRKILLALLLIIPIFSNIVQFHWLGTLYLIDRTALFYYPLIMLVFFFWASDIDGKVYKLFSIFSSLALTLVIFINFFFNINFHKTIEWVQDARTKDSLKYLQQLAEKENKTIVFDSSWPIENSIKYHLENGKYSNIEYVGLKWHRDSINAKANYYLYYNVPLPKVGYFTSSQPIEDYQKDTVLAFPEENLYLLAKSSQ